MQIPKFDEMLHPILALLSNGEIWRASDITTRLAEHLKLSDDALNQEYASGNAHIFADRASWARSYLSFSGLLHRPSVHTLSSQN